MGKLSEHGLTNTCAIELFPLCLDVLFASLISISGMWHYIHGIKENVDVNIQAFDSVFFSNLLSVQLNK